MKKYRVIVDGQEYEVGIEPLDASELKPMHQETAPVKKPEQADPALGGENVLSPCREIFCLSASRTVFQ